MTDKDKRQGGRPFKPSGKKPFAGAKGKGGKGGKGAERGWAAKGARPGGRAPKPEAPPKTHAGERIAKAMARAGACSRRDAEEWIAAGRVAVNGRTLDSPAFNVTASDRITIDGRPLAAREKTRLFLFHKPRGLVTTDSDPEGRPTVFDYLAERHPELPRLMSVGRLDINTEGLLLMTNDGGLARTLELPQTGWLRRYRARAHGQTDQAALDTLARGVTVDDVDFAPIEAKLDRAQGANTWITLALREGKNREVRRALGTIGLDVNRLIRVSYGPFQLGDIAEGAVEEVRTRVLRDQLGPSLIAQSLADFEAPIREESERAPRARRDERAPRDREFRPPRREAFSRDDRFAREEEPKKVERPKPGARKHVSKLRAERDQRMQDERVKVERRETADRKGRAVVVERVVPAKPKEEEVDSRNARRFKAERGRDERSARASRSPRSERDGDRPMRRRTEERLDARPPRGRRDEGGAPRRDGRTARSGQFRDDRENRSRQFRDDRDDRPARRPNRDEGRPERRERGPQGENRGGYRRDDRPAGEKRFSRDRTAGAERGERPARKGPPRDGAPRGDRPKGAAPRHEGGKRPPREGGARGGRPQGGAPRSGPRPPRGKK